jgi:hypothetical protein
VRSTALRGAKCPPAPHHEPPDPASPAAETAAGLLLLKSMPVEYLNVCAGSVCVNPFFPLASMWVVDGNGKIIREAEVASETEDLITAVRFEADPRQVTSPRQSVNG